MKKPLKRIVAPRWPEKTKATIKEESCRFCKLRDETPIHKGRNIRVLITKFPYLPKHVLIAPKGHVTSFESLDKRTFSEMAQALEKITRNGGVAWINNGLIAGQTIPHLHAHVIVPPTATEEEQLGVQVLHPGTEFFDPLSHAIIAFAARSSLISEKQEKKKAERPAVVLKFRNWRETGENLETISRTVKALENAFLQMKEQGLVPVPSGFSKSYGNKMLQLLSERTGQGFGSQIAFMKTHDGVEVHIIPRATVINPKKETQRTAGLEWFLNLKLSRGKELPKEWAKVQQDFEQQVGKSLRKRK